MRAGANPNDIITVLVYVLLFGGAIVNEIVKQIKKRNAQKQLEEQLARGKLATQPPPEFEVADEEDEGDGEEEEKPQRAEMPKDVKDIFEEIFGRPPQKSPTIQQRQIPLPKRVKIVKPMVELPRVQEQREIVRAEPTVVVPIPQWRFILKDMEFSEAQKLVVYSEILGKPKALKRRRA